MSANFVKSFFILSLLVFSSSIINSQSLNHSKSIYNWFDTTIGVGNIGIYNGVEYQKKYFTKHNNTEFYVSPDFLIGSVVYNKQPYFDIPVKYDVYNDEIIVKLPSQKSFIIINLIKSKVESFRVNEAHFVKLSLNLNNGDTGFFQVLYEDDNLKTYKKHLKNRKEKLDGGFVYDVFKTKIHYYLFYKNNYFVINSKKDIVKIFPQYRKNISSFFNENKDVKKSDFDLFTVRLTKTLSNLIVKDN